jgi:hypothetical protein
MPDSPAINEDLYTVLGVPPTATPAQLKERFRFLSHAFHPDKFATDAQRRTAETDFKRLNAAYQILSDPVQRAHFDAARGRPSATDTKAKPRPTSTESKPAPTAKARPTPTERKPPPTNKTHPTATENKPAQTQHQETPTEPMPNHSWSWVLYIGGGVLVILGGFAGAPPLIGFGLMVCVFGAAARFIHSFTE